MACESEESCVTSQQTTDSFLSDSKPTVRTSLDDYIFLYCEDGVNSFYINNYDPKIESENELLYLNEELDNWNEGLDSEMTKDMHLTYAFHNLFSHLDFSIFDLLWVRDFNIEIHVEYNYHTYENEEYGDDLDWEKCDYWD